MTDARTATTCEQCGQTDDHPKLHYGVQTFHHDCAPYTVIRDLTTYGYWRVEQVTLPDGQVVPQMTDWVDGPEIPPDELPVGTVRALEARRLAEQGTRGKKLLTAIVKMHEEG
jgi:hypothetical protein